MVQKNSLFAFCLFSAIAFHAYGQGCSDAGFCTLNSFKPNHADTLKLTKNQIKAGISYGKADNAITVVGPYLEYNRKLGKKLGLDIKITSLAQRGNGISVFGLSDVYLTTNYRPVSPLSITVGLKFPLTNGNRGQNGNALPMDYQSSLGTFDVILGTGITVGGLQIVAGYQQPLTQNNNQFTPDRYDPTTALSRFQRTSTFKRSGDVLLRVSYPVSLSQKIKVTPGILPIYHLAPDRFTDASQMQQNISGSEGLTLNGNLYLDWELSRHNALQVNFGMPFVVRKTRPDGLTRHFVVGVEYQVRF